MGVGDDQLHAGQPAGDQVTQERRPPGAVLAGQHVHPEDLAVAVGRDAGGDDGGHVHDAAGLPTALGARVHPHIDVGAAIQRPRPEGGHLGVQPLGELAHLRLGDALDAQGLHQALHAPGGDATHVALGHHRHQRPLGTPAGLQQPVREVAASPQLRDRQLDRADPGVQPPLAVAVAPVDPVRRTLANPAPHAASASAPINACTNVATRSRSRSASACSRCLRSQANQSIVGATTASSFTCSAKNLVKMTRWSCLVWDLPAPQARRTPRPWTLTQGAVVRREATHGIGADNLLTACNERHSIWRTPVRSRTTTA